MRKILTVLAIATLALPLGAQAQSSSPFGRWKTLDDETGKPMTIVEVYRGQGDTLAARIVENIAAPPTCTRCSGADKNRSIIGMNVLWGLRENNGTWGDGNGLKPSSGDTFRARSLELIDGGRKLKVTGCKARILCRSAEWVRE
ncbi:MAG: DUF2147 domain-containing protein [Pseudoxanthomonas suwonensis]|nr:DUF2147 domain-containing protein [Pseudoxanthomonas suwonensis]